jgi:hypothetical protein
MALTCKSGTFAANTSTGNQVVDTSTGVDGKAVLFYGHKITAAGNDTDLEFFIGAATAATERWTCWYESKDAAATSNASRRFDDTKCLAIYDANNGSPTANGEADFVSFGTGADAGKFTINWSDAPASAWIIHYLFLGGADLTNAKCGTFTCPNATGNQDITAVGFQPDFLMLSTVMATSDDATAPNNSIHAKIMVGFGTAANGGSLTFASEGNRPTWDCYRYQSTSRIYTGTDNQADDAAATLNSFLSNGFRLNWTLESGSGLSECFYLALKGGQYQVGSFTTQTGTGTFNVSSNFQGSGLIAMSTLSAAGTHTADASFSFGTASSSSARSGLGGDDTEGTEVADTRSSTSKIYENITAGTPTVNGEIDFVSFNTTDFTLDQTDADPSGQTVLFALFGSSPVSTRRVMVVS